MAFSASYGRCMIPATLTGGSVDGSVNSRCMWECLLLSVTGGVCGSVYCCLLQEVYVGVLMALSVTGVCGSVDDCLLQVYVKVCVEVWMAVC